MRAVIPEATRVRNRSGTKVASRRGASPSARAECAVPEIAGDWNGDLQVMI
jgi:hypothetical protein